MMISGRPSGFWPLAHLKSCMQLSSKDQVNDMFVAYIKRFENTFAPPGLPERLRKIGSESPGEEKDRARILKEGEVDWWLVLPFHPALDRCGLNKHLMHVLREPTSMAALWDAWQGKIMPNIRVSFSRGAPKSC